MSARALTLDEFVGTCPFRLPTVVELCAQQCPRKACTGKGADKLWGDLAPDGPCFICGDPRDHDGQPHGVVTGDHRTRADVTVTVGGRRVDIETGEILFDSGHTDAEAAAVMVSAGRPPRLCGAPVYGQTEDCGYVLTNAGSCPRHGRRKTGKDT